MTRRSLRGSRARSGTVSANGDITRRFHLILALAAAVGLSTGLAVWVFDVTVSAGLDRVQNDGFVRLRRGQFVQRHDVLFAEHDLLAADFSHLAPVSFVPYPA